MSSFSILIGPGFPDYCLGELASVSICCRIGLCHLGFCTCPVSDSFVSRDMLFDIPRSLLPSVILRSGSPDDLRVNDPDCTRLVNDVDVPLVDALCGDEVEVISGLKKFCVSRRSKGLADVS